jgi:hypothetical protein
MSDSEKDSDVESKKPQAETAAPKNETPRRTTRRTRQRTQLYQPGEGESPPKKRKRKTKVEEEVKVIKKEKEKEEKVDDSDKDGNDSSEDDDDDRVLSSPSKRKGGRKPRYSLLSEADLTCAHCQKVFTVKPGLDYHVENFVCRPTLRPGGPVVKGKRKKAASSGGGGSTKCPKSFNRIRGKLEDRTCPKCKRVFTSVLGLSYHVGTSIQ